MFKLVEPRQESLERQRVPRGAATETMYYLPGAMSALIIWVYFVSAIAVGGLPAPHGHGSGNAAKFCNDATSSFTSETPLYIGAIATTSTVLINQVAFPQADLSTPGGVVDAAAAFLATASRVKGSFQDIRIFLAMDISNIRTPPAHQTIIAVIEYYLVILVFTPILAKIGTTWEETAARLREWEESRREWLNGGWPWENLIRQFCDPLLRPLLQPVEVFLSCWEWITSSAMLAIQAALGVSVLMVSFFVLLAISTGFNSGFGGFYNCGTLRWSQGSSQLLNIASTLGLISQWNIMHSRRKVMAIPLQSLVSCTRPRFC